MRQHIIDHAQFVLNIILIRVYFVGDFLIKWIVSLYFMFTWQTHSEKNRFLPNKTAFQSKNLISMKTCTTFCIFYCRPCNLWNVCTREPTRNIRERATRYTHKKNVICKIQKLLTGWFAHFPSCERSEQAAWYYSANWLRQVLRILYSLYVSESFLIHLAIHLYIVI